MYYKFYYLNLQIDMITNVIGGLQPLIDKYLNFPFIINNMSVFKFNVVQFVIPILLL